MQTKDIPDLPILEYLLGHKNTWCTWYLNSENTVADAMPKGVISKKLILSKMRNLIKRGLVSGCACGCRGDFEITQKGILFVYSGVEHKEKVSL